MYCEQALLHKSIEPIINRKVVAEEVIAGKFLSL
jgi:hypothetical protein